VLLIAKRSLSKLHNISLLIDFIDDEVAHQILLNSLELWPLPNILGDPHRFFLGIADHHGFHRILVKLIAKGVVQQPPLS